MKRDTWIVGPYAIQPAGKPDECFYCRAKIGTEHAAGCVMRSRTVVIRTIVEHVVDVPEDWGEGMIEWHHGEKMCVIDSLKAVGALAARLEEADVGCCCGRIELDAEYVREATDEDEQASLMFVDGIDS